MKDVHCTKCDSSYHYQSFCPLNRKPIKVNKPLPRPTKRIKQRSTKELAYQSWKESECRPALIARDGNVCSCCGRYARDGEKLDIEHTLTKGSRPDLKRDLDNMTLMCRMPCHFKKTNGIPCLHL